MNKNILLFLITTSLCLFSVQNQGKEKVAEYIFDTTLSGFPAYYDRIKNISGFDSALAEAGKTITSIKQNDRNSGIALDDLTFWLENVHQAGTKVKISEKEITLNSDNLKTLSSASEQLNTYIDGALASEQIELLRTRRSNFLIESSGYQEYSINLDKTAQNVSFDNVTFHTQFAAICFNRHSFKVNQTIQINAIYEESSDPAVKVFGDLAENEFIISLTSFWGILLVLVLLALWLIVRPIRKMIKIWAVPLICLGILAINCITIFVSGSAAMLIKQQPEPIAIEIIMENPQRVVLSIPLNKRQSEGWVICDTNGELILCKYNPITHSMDAVIHNSGQYTLCLSNKKFDDISKLDPIMQTAVMRLTTHGIMSGTTDNMFEPNNQITRARLLSAVLYAFDLIDVTAQGSFIDVDDQDWYKKAVAVGQAEHIVVGYDDGTFRGDSIIPTDETIIIISNALKEKMGYTTDFDTERILSRFSDKADIDWRAKEAIALACRMGILLESSDGSLSPRSDMTKGIAAVLLNNMLRKIWY